MSDAEVARLEAWLAQEELSPGVVGDELASFGAEARDALVLRVARTLDPPPPGRLLARLPMIQTPENEASLASAFLANLHSPDPEARKASLYGLERLGHPAAADLATSALRDDEDAVLAAAADILLRRGGDLERVRPLLEQVLARHREDPRFHATRAVLAAHGIGVPPVP